jgi:hypothetical protein
VTEFLKSEHYVSPFIAECTKLFTVTRRQDVEIALEARDCISQCQYYMYHGLYLFLL